MPNTPKGLPYPVPTDPLAGGAAAIQALASAVDAQLRTTYRKTTPKLVTNTGTETDLLNGELTVAAGVLGTNRMMRLVAWGDWYQNAVSGSPVPRFRLRLGPGAPPAVVIDANTPGNPDVRQNATRYFWSIAVEVVNLGAANAQMVAFHERLTWSGAIGSPGTAGAAFATGQGVIATSGAAPAFVVAGEGFNSAAIDTTAAMPVQLTVVNAWTTASETKLFGAIAEIV